MPWLVRVEGDDKVLHSLLNEINGGDLVLAATRETDGFVLVSTLLDREMKRSTAESAAARLVGRISGVARLLVDDLDIDTRLRVKRLDQLAESIAPRTRSRRSTWLERAYREPGFARVLELIGQGVYWEDVAEIRRIIGAAIGGEDRFAKLGIASARELERLSPRIEGAPLPRSVELLVLRMVHRCHLRGEPVA